MLEDSQNPQHRLQYATPARKLTAMPTAAPSAATPSALPALLSRHELRVLLLDGDLEAVEGFFQGWHAAHAAGTLTEEELERAYDVATCYREDLTAPLRAWAGAYPDSYPAQVALGVHLFGHGLKLRTMRLARDIPEEHLEALAGAFGAAEHQLRHATTLDPQATLAVIHLIHFQTQQGERAWDEYAEGVRRAPESLALRLAMLGNLRTEWGGSEAAQDRFLTRAEHEGLSEHARARLKAARLKQRAHHLTHFQNDPVGVRQAYRQSIEVQPTAYALSGLADLSGLWAKRKLHDQALALAPHDDHIRASRAVGRLESWAPAGRELATLRDCAAWGEPFATDYLNAPLWVMRLRPVFLAMARRRGE